MSTLLFNCKQSCKAGITETLLTYVTTLAFYLHIRSGPPTTTQSNTMPKAILERLLTLKHALLILDEPVSASDDGDADEDDDEEFDLSSLNEEEKAELERIFGPSRGSYTAKESMDSLPGRKKMKLDIDELDTLLKEADSPVDDLISKNDGASARAKSHFRKAKADVKTTPSLGTPTFDLVEPTFVPSKGSAARPSDNTLDAYGEATSLSMVDDTDKKARKRSLRFHTNKIETSARRREGGREKLGGT
jgi:U3 small nucleolar RNA-associated protein 3